MEHECPQTVPLEDYERLTRKFNELYGRYRLLQDKHAKCRSYIQEANRKYDTAKKAIRQWREYIDKKHLAQSKPGHDNDIDLPDVPHLPSDHAESSGRKAHGLKSVNVTTGNSAGHDDNNNQSEALGPPSRACSLSSTTDKPASQRHSSQDTRRITSSQTTEDASEDEAERVGIKLEAGSDDTPKVISARSLKRKRSDSAQKMPPPRRIKREPRSSTDPVELNSEDFSSPVAKRKPMRMETSDLDAGAERTIVPQRRRCLFSDRERAVSEEVARPVLKLSRRISSFSDGDIRDSSCEETIVKDEPEVDHVGTRGHPAASRRIRIWGMQSADHKLQAEPLRPLSVNVPTPSRTNTKPRANGKPVPNEQVEKVAFLSEDGDQDNSQAFNVRVSALAPKPISNHRLDNMLDVPSPDRQPLPRRTSPETTSTIVRKRPPERAEQSRATETTSRHQDTVTFKVPRGLEMPPAPVRPEDEPLRLRPLGMLRLDDFKINPKYMGVDYAFADTLRGRDQRRCMQGCTKPECCGNAFVKVLQIGGAQVSAKSDAEVLKEYLGENFATIMGAYDKSKREDLLMQARAHAFANQHGKHRQAFERRSTPPGFWRTDMPNTQEEIDDRLKAKQMVRLKVEERWREAMREGGRWIFRDE